MAGCRAAIEVEVPQKAALRSDYTVETGSVDASTNLHSITTSVRVGCAAGVHAAVGSPLAVPLIP
jgi:hypothetical protein